MMVSHKVKTHKQIADHDIFVTQNYVPTAKILMLLPGLLGSLKVTKLYYSYLLLLLNSY